MRAVVSTVVPDFPFTDLSAQQVGEWLSRVVATTPEPIVTVDGTGQVVQLNPAAEELFGYRRVALLGKRFVELLTPAEQCDDFWSCLLRAVDCEGPVAHEASARIRAKRQSGEEIPVELIIVQTSASPLLITVFVRAPLDLDASDQTYAEAANARLSERELEVLMLASEGHSGPEIAETLIVSSSTVKSHFQNIYSKLSVTNRGAAVAKGLRLGLIR